MTDGQAPISSTFDLATTQAIFDGSPNGLISFDMAGPEPRIISVNPAARALVRGTPPAGATLAEAFPSLAVPDFLALLASVKGRGERRPKVRIETGSGEGGLVFAATAIGIDDSRVAVILDNITAIHRDAEELRRARLLLERAEDMAGIGSWEFDYLTKTVNGSPGAVKIYGAPSSGLRVSDMETVPLPEYRPLLNKARDEHITKGLPYDVVFKIKRMSDGAIRDIHSRAAWDAAHKRLFGILRDITEEKEAQDAIQSLNRDLESRVEERTRELSVSNAALGQALRELEASRERQILAEKMAALGRLVAALAHELNTPIGAIHSESESGLRDAALLAERLTGLRGATAEEFEALIALVSGSASSPDPDPADDRRLRRKLRAWLEPRLGPDSNSLAELLVDLGFAVDDAALERMVALPSFPALVQLAWELTAPGRAAAVTFEAAEKAGKVVKALRTYSAGGLGQRIVRLDPRKGLEATLGLLARRAGPGIAIELDFGEATEVLCFPEQLEQVWNNIALNAIQAMQGSGTLRVWTRREGDFLLTSFADDGPGIPEELQGRVFTPFFSTKPAGEGSGLGLDIARRVLDEIGGSISFESRPGLTIFTVRLKAAPAETPS